MKPAQVKMARGALGWSSEDLAKAANVHRNTVNNFETGRYGGKPEVLDAIQKALEDAGVIFLDDDGTGPGIRLKNSLDAAE